ncbi:MAG: response regulator transcription factor [Elusimicrobia bacterium]|nr:response regulator transcription factor [Elusimicrobiota bacterium]
MKILIAEDDPNFRALLLEILTESGHQPLIEENGLLAWDRLNKDGADMAILDVNMPVMTGFELLKKIRHCDKHKNMPVIMLTIREFVSDQVEGYDTGADDYLTKPFDRHVLLSRIGVLERRIIKKRKGT